MTETEYKKLKAAHEEAAEAAAEARGAVTSIAATLAKEFGLTTREESRKKLKELATKKAKLGTELEEALEAYKQEFPDDNE